MSADQKSYVFFILIILSISVDFYITSIHISNLSLSRTRRFLNRALVTLLWTLIIILFVPMKDIHFEVIFDPKSRGYSLLQVIAGYTFAKHVIIDMSFMDSSMKLYSEKNFLVCRYVWVMSLLVSVVLLYFRLG